MIHRMIRLVAFLATVAAPAQLASQETERPVPFDQAGRLMTISSALATRLNLGVPQWPVVGSFVDARLYERTGGTFVIIVQRLDGSNDRYPLSAEAARELSELLGRAMLTANLSTPGDRTDLISEPAGARFVINQVAAGFLVYGPAASALAGGATAPMLYFLTAGGTFFAASAVASSQVVTKAQNSLATDGIWRGALVANGLRYAAGIGVGSFDDNGDAVAIATLAGAIGGTVLGLNIGRSLTDAEAAGAATGSTIIAATAMGLIGIAGGWQADEARGEVGTLVATGLAGLPLGLRYVRRAPYRVTEGDVSTVLTAGMLGALSSTVLIPNDPNERTGWGIVTGGFLAGVAVGERSLARAFDFTASEAGLVRLGAVAGALIGFAVSTEMENERAVLSFGSAGAILGTVMTLGIIKPRRSQ